MFLSMTRRFLPIKRSPNSAVARLTLPPDTSLLKLNPGDEITLTESDFVTLSNAFFNEIETKYL